MIEGQGDEGGTGGETEMQTQYRAPPLSIPMNDHVATAAGSSGEHRCMFLCVGLSVFVHVFHACTLASRFVGSVFLAA